MLHFFVGFEYLDGYEVRFWSPNENKCGPPVRTVVGKVPFTKMYHIHIITETMNFFLSAKHFTGDQSQCVH